jgi:hypothetical protein
MTKTARRLMADLPAASTPLAGTELVTVEIGGRKYRVPVIDTNDRDSGTWTPVLSDGTNNATSNIQSGTWYRHGPLLYAAGDLRTSSLGSVSGSLRITGFPEASGPTAGHLGVLVVGNAFQMNLPAAGYSITGRIPAGDDFVSLGLWGSTGGTIPMTNTHWSEDGWLRFSILYPIE